MKVGYNRRYYLTILKFGLTSALFGFFLHVIWGNLQVVHFTVGTGFLIGTILGSLEPLLLFKRLPYLMTLVIRTILYFMVITVSVYLFLVLYLKSIGLETVALQDQEKFQELSKVYFLANVNLLYLLLIALIGSFTWQVKAFFGKNVLKNYLVGRYHKPSVEERIFMFLDLDSATTLAEKLGPVKYSSLLRSFFMDIDQAITSANGQVYQYVGDEVVVIWKTKTGLRNSNCLRSFANAIDTLENRKEYYLRNWEVFPSFKAALHIGKVSITEIGVSKKEIAYHGDAINTTARICGSAHDLNRNILISSDLFNRLQKKDEFNLVEVGEHSFKGKDERIVLYTLENSIIWHE